MPRHTRHALTPLLLLLLAPLDAASAQVRLQGNGGATDVYRRFAPYVRKIQVVEGGSAAKSALGSGFYVSPDGYLVTNFHVISNIINRPERYRAELVDERGATSPVSVVAVDVVHDLAVLKSDARGQPYFALAPVRTTHGERLFSLGNPKDLGMSIVEGTYNGLLQHTLYPRIHLTASLNHGMSGGPTIDERGQVVGINVSTEGNQVSFLVPVDFALALLDSARAAKSGGPPTLAQVGAQLKRHQESYLKNMFAGDAHRIDFGPFKVITEPAPFFRCWGDADHDEEQPYESSQHYCSTEDEIFLDEMQMTGSLSLSHRLYTTKSLNAAQFFTLYTNQFSADHSPMGKEEYVTNWKCVTRNVNNTNADMRTVMCLRRYKKLGELYDAWLQLAMLGRPNVGLVSTLNVTGATYENIERVTQRYLRNIAWR